MRLRFSLRTFFILVALLAAFCYWWFVLPSVTANRFIQAIAAKDYVAADRLFSDPKDRFIAAAADKYWAFETTAELGPITFGQLLTGQRHVSLHYRYFHLDLNVDSIAQIPATPFGLQSPVISTVDAAMIIDRSSDAAVPRMR
jgi:hypothetical protein